MIFSIPGKPRGRGRVERFFATINQRFLCRLPGYSPPGCKDQKPVWHLDTLEQAFRTFIIEDYHRKPHGETSITPLDRWQENGFLPQLPESLEQLDLLLLSVAKSRRVQQDGIRFQTLRYFDTLLAAYVGESITIRYDPNDMAEIRVFHQNRFLCRAVCQELAGETISLKDIIRARQQRQRDLRQTIEHRRSIVDQWFKSPSVGNHAAASAKTIEAIKPKNINRTTLKRYAND